MAMASTYCTARAIASSHRIGVKTTAISSSSTTIAASPRKLPKAFQSDALQLLTRVPSLSKLHDDDGDGDKQTVRMQWRGGENERISLRREWACDVPAIYGWARFPPYTLLPSSSSTLLICGGALSNKRLCSHAHGRQSLARKKKKKKIEWSWGDMAYDGYRHHLQHVYCHQCGDVGHDSMESSAPLSMSVRMTRMRRRRRRRLRVNKKEKAMASSRSPWAGVEHERESAKEWVHFVGIGGSGLSALALLCLKQGFHVSGSDVAWNDRLERLQDRGVVVFTGHAAEHVRAEGHKGYGGADVDDQEEEEARGGGGGFPDCVVVSSAVKPGNVEVEAASALGSVIYSRAEWLQRLTEGYDLLAVAGTHGKSTTSAMLAYVLRNLGDDITAIIGADVSQFPGEENALIGSSERFVLEADEYDYCFLHLSPAMAIVTNVEWEHVDIFPNVECVRKAFRKFARRIKPGGTLITYGDCAGSKSLSDVFITHDDDDDGDGDGDQQQQQQQQQQQEEEEEGVHVESVTGKAMGGSRSSSRRRRRKSGMERAPWLDVAEVEKKRSIVTYGIGEANDWRAVGLIPNSIGGTDFVVVFAGMRMAQVSLQIPGIHNVLNALAVIVLVCLIGVEEMSAGDDSKRSLFMESVAQGASATLRNFVGIRRRFEFVGRARGCQVYDDYAHHPTEVRATLQAARQRFDRQPIWIIFQMHTYSRLSKLLEDFAPAFSAADRVIVTQIDGAREVKENFDVTAQDLVNAITGPVVTYIPEQEKVIDRLSWEIATSSSAIASSSSSSSSSVGLNGGRGEIIVFTMGAGNITLLGPRLLKSVDSRFPQ